VSGSGISWAICKSTSRSREITTPAPHRSVFTGRMPFLPPNQKCQSTEGKQRCSNNKRNNFLAIESSTYGITCRLVQQTLLAFASLTSHLITITFYCTVNWIFQDNLDKLVPEWQNQSGSKWGEIITPTPHHSIFTGRMLFLTPHQQCQSTEGNKVMPKNIRNTRFVKLPST